MKVMITDEMRDFAKAEAQKRNAFIKHHFEVNHLTYEQRDELGFLGEFACCVALGIDWKANIRENYYTIDDYDFNVNNKRIDLKTETVPFNYANKILNGTIKDDELYGRRLIHKGQFSLLSKYDLVIFGLFIRDQMDFWYSIGYIETRLIIENYPPTDKRPDGTPCWVRDGSESWHLRYSNGSGKFYKQQRKSGDTLAYNQFKPFDPNNLPLNE